MAKKYISKYTGEEIDELLGEVGKRFGYFYSEQDSEAGTMTIYCFDSRAHYADWVADKEANAELLLQTLVIPIPSTGDGMSTIVDLTTKTNRTQLITTDETVKLLLRFTSYTYNSATGEKRDTDETCTIVVQKRANVNASWQTAGEIKGVASISYADESSYTEVDISSYVDKGSSQVRVQAIGDDSGKATPSVLFSEVIKTNLSLKLANDWWNPITDRNKSTLSFYVEGAVDKTLKIILDSSKEELVFGLGKTTYIETPYSTDITEEAFLTNGLHKVKAWIEVPVRMDNGDTQIIKGKELSAQLLHVYEDYNLGTQVVLNNVVTEATNWVDLDYFDYAIYKPDADFAPIDFSLYSLDRKTRYSQYYDEAVATQTKHTYRSTMEVDEDDKEFSVAMVVSSDEKELESYFIEVDNTMNFAPTQGADFVLNPKMHSNTGGSAKIYNDATGEQLPATFTNFGFVNDGYVSDENGVRCLRVLAGSSLDITYEAFSDFLGTNNTKSLTIEIDFATRNITNEDDAILKMCSYLASDGNPLGWEMKPLEACFMTNKLRYRKDQDIMWQEGVRTRVAVNIVYNLANRGLNYIRIFVNGTINREMSYDTNDTFVFGGTSQGIRIGQQSADIDIYGIRIYKKALSSSDVMQDYKASLATTDEKRAFQDANAILGDNGTIAYSLVFGKYNTLLWKYNDRAPKTQLATYGNTKDDSYKGDLVINKVGDDKHSGTYRYMKTKGQGTSSMSYWKWNQRFQPEDDGFFTNNLGEEYNGYQLEDGLPFATRLDGKINWASSMQSHKMGATALYQDVWSQLVADGILDSNTLMKHGGGQEFTQTSGGYKDCRLCVKQNWFMMFVQESEGATPTFYGLYTWGAGKGDKPTFGVNEEDFPDFTVLEGCDNGKPLVVHRVPWDSHITGSQAAEVWKYAGEDNWEISMGSGNLWEHYRNAFNFVYLHHTDIRYFTGTFEELKKSDPKVYPVEHDYWVTTASTGANRYDLFRYDPAEKQWVKAGLERATLNLSTQLGITPSGTVWTEINKAFIEERRRRFSEQVGSYYDVKDTCYTMAFLKLLGATDNWGKNTYLYKVVASDPIRFMQDDLDTIKLIDNVGRKTKPYYMEEHDKDEDGEYFCPSERNAFYNLMEQCFPDLIRSMEKSILRVIASLGGGSLEGGFQRYFYDIQEQIPAVAYNEIARLLYEDAAVALADGRYKNNTPPLPQCLGDQLQAEKQWDSLRFVYLSSYAGYGMFDKGEVSGALSFRSIGTNPQYAFTIVPHIWMYPAFGSANSAIYTHQRVQAGQSFTNEAFSPSSDANVRICAIDYLRDIGDFAKHQVGEALNLSGARLTQFVAAYSSEVNDADKAFRIEEISSNIAAPNMELVNLTNVSTLTGDLNLAKQIRLRELRLAGTSLTSVTLPKTEMLTLVVMPSTLSSLVIDGQTRLASITIASVKNLSSITIKNAPKFDSYSFVANRLVEAGSKVTSIDMDVSWTNCSSKVLKWLMGIKNCHLRGTIQMGGGQTVDFATKVALVNKFGNIDDEANPLHIKYAITNLTSAKVEGADGYEIIVDEDYESILDENGNEQYHTQYQFTLSNPLPSTSANDITGVEWHVSDDTYVSIDNAGLLTVKQQAEGKQFIEVYAKIYTLANTEGFETSRKQFRLYYRQAEVGDYVYHDGTYSQERRYDKTVIGRCFYVEVLEDGYVDRRMVAVDGATAVEFTSGYPHPGASAFTLTPETEPDKIDATTDDGYGMFDNYNGEKRFRDFTIVYSLGLSPHTGYKFDIKYDELVDASGAFRVAKNGTFAGTGIKNNGNLLDSNINSQSGVYTVVESGARTYSRYGNATYTLQDYFETIRLLAERNVGERIPLARLQFLQIIYRRNRILNDPKFSDYGGVPTASSNASEMENLENQLGNLAGDYKRVLFVPYSQCYAYEPSAKKIKKTFKAHNWYAMSPGEVMRFRYHNQTMQIVIPKNITSCPYESGNQWNYTTTLGAQNDILGAIQAVTISHTLLVACAF